MDIKAFIESGIIENFCLGFCTEQEILEVQNLCKQFPVIQQEIEKVRECFEQQLHEAAIPPSPSVKTAVMRSVYAQHAGIDRRFVPLISNVTDAAELKEWVAQNEVERNNGDFENLHIIELPSTDKVINFIVVAKIGHEEEVHTDFVEYLFVIKGSCIMDFEGTKKNFKAGEIISIAPGIKHTAMVSSKHPMLAVVQRQFLI